eukprot:158393-Amphidinium_carterae.1
MKNAAKGLDHWSATELAMLSEQFAYSLARVFHHIEAQGVVPPCMTQQKVIMLPKPLQRAEGLKVRPILLLPMLYRIWAQARAKQIKQVAGGKPGQSIQELLVPLLADTDIADLCDEHTSRYLYEHSTLLWRVMVCIGLAVQAPCGQNRLPAGCPLAVWAMGIVTHSMQQLHKGILTIRLASMLMTRSIT